MILPGIPCTTGSWFGLQSVRSSPVPFPVCPDPRALHITKTLYITVPIFPQKTSSKLAILF